MASTVWKGHLSFGLVSMPVKLFAGSRSDTGVSFNQLHAKCKNKINMPKVCMTCDPNAKLETADIVKGYEVQKGTFITITDEEIKAAAPKSEKTMAVSEFVDENEVSPRYYESTFFLVPEAAGEKVYALLLAALRKEKKAAIAYITMRQREHVVLIRPEGKGLMAHTLFYNHEVRDITEYSGMQLPEVSAPEVAMGVTLIAALSKPFNPTEFQDSYRGRLLNMIEAKKNGQEITPEVVTNTAPVTDLMAALQASLAAAKPAVTPVAAPAPAPVEVPVVEKKGKKKAS